MTYSDNYNIRTTSVKFNDVADALDGLITRNYAGLTTGTSTAYIATPSPAWDAYTTSGLVVIIPHVTNTGASTIDISGLGARDLKIGNVAITAGVLQQNVPTIMAYTGTYFEVLLQQTTIPVGTIYTYAGTTSPSGYLLCDGTAYNTYTYRVLHAIVSNIYGGTAYSAGVTDQSGAITTFNLPDLRRRAPVGKGASDTLGASDGVAYASRSMSHSHSVPAHSHGLGTLATGTTGSGHAHAFALVADTGGAHTHTINARQNATAFGTLGALARISNSGTAADIPTGFDDVSGTTTNEGAHSHSISGSVGGSDGTHTHNLTGNIGATGSGVSGDSSMTSGSNTANYIFINYIIKF